MLTMSVGRNSLLIVCTLLIFSCSGNVIQTTVFSDGFQELDQAQVPLRDKSEPAICYDAARGILGQWQVASDLPEQGFDQAWIIRERDGRKYLAQNFTNLDDHNSPISLVTHPMLVAGDSLWEDYTIEVDFTPRAKFDKCGLVFAYQHPFDFCFFGIEGNTVTLKHVQQPVTPLRPIERTLDIHPLVWNPGDTMHAVLTVRRNKVNTILNDSIQMHSGDLSSTRGKVGVISDIPADFHRIEVRLLKDALRQQRRRTRQITRREDLRISEFPLMVRWKHLQTGDYGSGQNIRLGDLTGDGNKEILFATGEANDRGVRSVNVCDLEGNLLWQYGRSPSSPSCSGREVPVQIHDLDGDGEREVLLVRQGRLLVLRGKDGKVLRNRGLPSQAGLQTMLFADLKGAGRDNCILLSDRDQLLMALDEKLDLLWWVEPEGGCQPMVHDMDGDGLQEVLMGYSVFGPDGKLVYDVGEYIGDRCQGVSIYEMVDQGDTTECLVYAAGDWGLMYFDFGGHLLKQNILGHVDFLGIANLDLERAGLEILTSNRWGSRGLMHSLDASGKLLARFLPEAGVNRCMTVNWKGDGEEFLFTSADSTRGGLYNLEGQLSVRFPSDGHPQTYGLAQDLTGDARDEILVWDAKELWIYTQEDNPRMGHTYHPHRTPLYNYSMYQMNRSLPGW